MAHEHYFSKELICAEEYHVQQLKYITKPSLSGNDFCCFFLFLLFLIEQILHLSFRLKALFI